MAFDAAKNTFHGYYKAVAEYVTPIDESSAFHEKGVLTPEEFVNAGIQLVYKCPTWSWEGGDAKKRKKFLPANQQYLISRNLPCLKRVKSLELDQGSEEIVENGEWLSMTENKDTNNLQNEIADIDLDDIDSHNKSSKTNDNNNNAPLINIVENYDAIAPKQQTDDPTNNKSVEDDDDSEDFVEIPDIDDFDDLDNVVQPTKTNKNAPNSNAKNNEQMSEQKTDMLMVSEEANIISTRTYDISITYDKYYRVPRVWLRGYSENGTPLTSHEIFEDISADHAHKTVTVEAHPHTGIVSASIHPCRHSEVMKRFMSKFEENGKQMTVDQYMFLFLKFMSAVIPTIQYDFTQSVQAK